MKKKKKKKEKNILILIKLDGINLPMEVDTSHE